MIDPETVFTPFPRLETERLTLREIRPSDAPAIFAAFSDEAVTRYYGLEQFTALAQAEQRISAIRQNYADRRSLRWAITRHSDNYLIGTCGFMDWKRNFHHASLGYELARDYWHQGYMTEALTAVITFGFTRMGLNRIQALVMPANSPSLRLLEKLGFHNEGRLRQYGFWASSYHDLYILSLLHAEAPPNITSPQD